jgi:hypothetical protein
MSSKKIYINTKEDYLKVFGQQDEEKRFKPLALARLSSKPNKIINNVINNVKILFEE